MTLKELNNLNVRNVLVTICTLAESDTIKTLIKDFGLEYEPKDNKPIFVTIRLITGDKLDWYFRIKDSLTGEEYEASKDSRLLNKTTILTDVIEFDSDFVDVEHFCVIPQRDFLTLINRPTTQWIK
jgi:hypothetical protein